MSQVVGEPEEIAPLCYVASPYGDRGGYEAVSRNIQIARDAAVWLVQEGFYFICPHLNSQHMECTFPSLSIEHWYGQDLRLMSGCDCMVVAGEWKKSKGVGKELQVAEKKGMPVFDLTTTEGRADLLTWRDQWIAKRVGVDLAQVVRSMADDAPAM